MTKHTVHAEWQGAQRFLLHDRTASSVLMAHPEGVNGADLLPLSLIGCVGWDVATILAKQRQRVSRLAIHADCTQDDEPPWRYRRIHLRYHVVGSDLDAGRVARAIDLAESSYCSIYATLKDCVALSRSVEVVEDRP